MSDAAGIEANNVFVRWEVEISGEPLKQTWKDSTVQQAWIAYYSKHYFDKQGFCYVSGKNGPLAELHPAKIRNAGDSAKLISSNDSANYTFRGRFENADKACQVGVEISIKAHNALRWLIAKQGTTVGNGLTVVSWCSASIMAPQLLGSTQEVFGDEDEETEVIPYSTAEEFAHALNHRLLGYYGDLSNTDKILIMGLNAASPGRMSIVLYREFATSDFCEVQEYWHGNLAWYYSYWKKTKEGKSKLIHTISAPSPMEIAKAAYGEHLNDNIKTMAIKRLLACILDKTPIPSDMEKLCFDRATRLVTIEEGIREKVLETACAVIRYNAKENYTVEWDKERKTRDYLFGSLLAIADKVESQALYARDGENKRETNAVRYMHRFSKYPASTWNLLYVEKLRPYFSQLKDKSRDYYEGLIREIEPEIKSEDFVDRPLSPEFLLGYHSLQKKFWDDLSKKNADKTADKTQEE
jgi:CRISPR-associated protein Csd1